ncbi:hypothetical protein BJ138DRAFT_1223402 [Hygrophoropsis aurantiaca]|uniref:Uncharacterized protein n=1 Tax=Hygrophoropsis aurantiaca TaxID=72124 RepID=A0ACB7ZZP7_9AGAM|nr:hypothetical protein BJ138DRAFT_1223402 [Hygrophoropsis aurantiaca]
MDCKSWISTVDKPGSTLKHATSALAFPLNHGVTPDDLKCSADLWKNDPMNTQIPVSERRPHRTWIDCLPTPHLSPGPSLKIRTIAWHFRHALVTFCDDFHHFKPELGMPETVNQIPVTKTSHIPCRAMDINSSTNDGQAQIVEHICMQANIGDPTDFPSMCDVREHVMLVHGDLGTAERLHGIKQSRSIETKEVRRLQPVVFVMGLFHLQMACTEALWRMFIEPKSVRADPHSLYSQACQVRPHDSGRIGSKPGFRLIHDIAHHCGYARMLDCWRVEVKRIDNSWTTLELFAKSKPTYTDLVRLSLVLASTYVDKPAVYDKVFRNNSLILARLIQYLEITHALKHGDIGRVEETFLHWVFVFKSTGKHKYATHLIQTMNDLKYVYPEGLKRAIRLNWLCNPTGKVDGFRAIDWLVELMNLYTKVVYGSSGSARTFELILKQSPLIEIFRRVHVLIQDNFHMLHRSVRHAPPNLKNTLSVLCALLEKHKAHEIVPNRNTSPEALKDHFKDGMLVLQTQKGNQAQGEDEDDARGELEFEDLEA